MTVFLFLIPALVWTTRTALLQPPRSGAAAWRISQVYRRVLVVLFGVGICLPLLDFRFELDPGLELSENRPAPMAPAWPKSAAEWSALPNLLQAYWNDAFGFRRRLIHWRSVTELALGVSPNPSVAIGKDRWLFFTGDESFEQHRGARPFSDPELRDWAEQLEARRLWLASRGAHYLFVIAPDKQTIYPDQVPARSGPFGRTPADELVPYLHAHTGVDVLDLRGSLRVARAEGAVFTKTDTHWNDRGAFTAYTAIVTRLHARDPRMTPRPRIDFIRSPLPLWNGDLSLMLPGLYGSLSEGGEQWQPSSPTAAHESNFDALCPPESLRYALFETANRADLPRAVFFHDSFLLAPDERLFQPQPAGALPVPSATFRLRSLLAEQFSRSAFTWQYEFNQMLIEHEHPDFVIQEYVERKLRSGPKGAPLPAAR